MRLIGHLEAERAAQTFSDYLYVRGIENEVEADKEGWAIWILAEEDLERAGSLLAGFRENPHDKKYEGVQRMADELREQKRQEKLDYNNRLKKRGELFRTIRGYNFGPVSFVLIFICVAVFLVKFFYGTPRIFSLFISMVDLRDVDDLNVWKAMLVRVSAYKIILPEIHQGEIWRLVTPIFIHFNFLHLLFNVLCLADFGSMVERRQKSWLLLVQVLVFAAISNLAQYLFFGQGFGGMSGVNYALLGYIWVRGKLDPGSGLYLHQTTVVTAMIWFFGCWIGLMGNVANVCHAAGLIAGLAWGALSSLRHRR